VSPGVLVDELQVPLSLEKAWVRFPGRGRLRPGLIAHLRRLGVVRQLVVTGSRRDVLCVLVYRAAERERVRAAVYALRQPVEWDEIIEEDRVMERAVWIALAQRLADAEGLLVADTR
jgi:hypothetical protein